VASHEPGRNPTWFTPAEAKRALQKGREVKYSNELHIVVDRVLERIRGRDKALAVTSDSSA
jgi:hypothetical protein